MVCDGEKLLPKKDLDNRGDCKKSWCLCGVPLTNVFRILTLYECVSVVDDLSY
jgi:hypothetical protein